jgi:hypothetical protein
MNAEVRTKIDGEEGQLYLIQKVDCSATKIQTSLLHQFQGRTAPIRKQAQPQSGADLLAASAR